MISQFDHRFGTYHGQTEAQLNQGKLPELTTTAHADPTHSVLPKYWIKLLDVQARIGQNWDYRWLICWRDITSTNLTRTVSCSVMPVSGTNYTLRVGFFSEEPIMAATVIPATMNSFVFDYCARQMLGGIHLSDYITKQLPMVPPHTYSLPLMIFIVPRVLELTYTAWDLQSFAQDVGYQGAPFVWDDDRRFVLRAELDALYFHLYGINRDDVDYIMDSFPIVKRKDVEKFGSYITKAAILDVYDQFAALPKITVPAPKGGGTMLVPNVSQYVTPLDPPPGDARAAHQL